MGDRLAMTIVVVAFASAAILQAIAVGADLSRHDARRQYHLGYIDGYEQAMRWALAHQNRSSRPTETQP